MVWKVGSTKGLSFHKWRWRLSSPLVLGGVFLEKKRIRKLAGCSGDGHLQHLLSLAHASVFFFSLTVWDLQEWRFVGLLNFKMFFEEPALRGAVTNTLIHAVTTSGLKTVLALLIAVGLASKLPTRNFCAR